MIDLRAFSPIGLEADCFQTTAKRSDEIRMNWVNFVK